MPPTLASPFQITPLTSVATQPGTESPATPTPSLSIDELYTLTDAPAEHDGKVQCHPAAKLDNLSGLGDGRDWSMLIDDLAHPVAELIRIMRHWALGPQEQSTAFNQLRLNQGFDAAVQTYATFAAFVRLLALGPRRRLKVHAPLCPSLTADEIALAHFFVAAQSDPNEARIRASWLVRDGIGAEITLLAERMMRQFAAT